MNGDRHDCARRCLTPLIAHESGVVRALTGRRKLLSESDLAVAVRVDRRVVEQSTVRFNQT